MKKIALAIVTLSLALNVMAQSDMQHRVGASVGVGVGSLRQQFDAKTEGANAKFGSQEMLELDYLFLSQPLGDKQLVRLGARVGLGFDALSNRVTADRAFDDFNIIDCENRPIDYNTEVTGISEKNTLYSLTLPIQLVLHLENGLYAGVGIRVMFPTSGSYYQTTTANNIVAYYPTLDVHEPNQFVTGKMTQGYSAEGKLALPKTMCNVDFELGYEWTLATRHFLRLTAYCSIPTVNGDNAQGLSMLSVSDPGASGAKVTTESLTTSHGTRMQELSFGVRFGYSFNVGK